MAFSTTILDRITCVNNKLWYVYECMFNPKGRQQINRLLFYLYQQARYSIAAIAIVKRVSQIMMTILQSQVMARHSKEIEHVLKYLVLSVECILRTIRIRM